jgi:hypothetical protein
MKEMIGAAWQAFGACRVNEKEESGVRATQLTLGKRNVMLTSFTCKIKAPCNCARL